MSNATLGTLLVTLGAVSALCGVVLGVFALFGWRVTSGAPAHFWWVRDGLCFRCGAVMARALITRDFTVAFVAQNGSSRTPPLFNVATLWSALEGSILLWLWFFAVTWWRCSEV